MLFATFLKILSSYICSKKGLERRASKSGTFNGLPSDNNNNLNRTPPQDTGIPLKQG